MPVDGEPSKLCKDIFELEKDFRYNLFLLKVRDTEIARCKTQNEHLLHELKQKNQVYSTVRIKLRDFESELKSANTEKARMRISYEETISGLSSSLAELKKTHENYQREQRSEEKKREAELHERGRRILEGKEKDHQREMAEMNDQLHREMCLGQKLKTQLQEIIIENISIRNEFQEKQFHYISKISVLESELKASQEEIETELRKTATEKNQEEKLKTQLQEIITENISLQNAFRDKQFQYSSKLSALESELKTSQEEKINLQMKLDSSKKDFTYFETELRKTITEKDQVKQELSESDERNRISQRKLNEISVEKDNLQLQLNTTTLQLQTCLEKLDKTNDEKDKLKAEFEHCKRVNAEVKCTNPEHGNIDDVLKQNSVLQEVVKAMRRERSEIFDAQQMERKMEKLEELVQCLKSSMLNKLDISTKEDSV